MYYHPTTAVPTYAPPLPTAAPVNIPSIMEQMGTDPTSKLAAAIERLCDLLEGVRD